MLIQRVRSLSCTQARYPCYPERLATGNSRAAIQTGQLYLSRGMK
jgi:hypothetical protein